MGGESLRAGLRTPGPGRRPQPPFLLSLSLSLSLWCCRRKSCECHWGAEGELGWREGVESRQPLRGQSPPPAHYKGAIPANVIGHREEEPRSFRVSGLLPPAPPLAVPPGCRGDPPTPTPGTPAAGTPRPVPAGLGCAERAAEPGEAAAGERAAVRGIRGCGGARSRSERRRERGSPGLEPAAPRRGLSAADQSERSGLCCAGAPLPHFQHARHFATFKGSEKPLGVAVLRRACGEM